MQALVSSVTNGASLDSIIAENNLGAIKKANPLALADDGSSSESEDETEESKAGEKKLFRASKGESILNMDKRDEGKSRQRVDTSGLSKKLKNNELFKDILEEFSSVPQSISNSGEGTTKRKRAGLEEEQELKDFEEDRFVRLVQSKADKKRLQGMVEPSVKSGWDEIQESLEGHYNELQNLSQMTESGKSKKMSKKREKLYEDDGGSTFVDAFQAVFDKKKKAVADHFDESKDKTELRDTVEDKRAVSDEIMKNRGLVPHRKKSNRNARVKKREQYGKAVIKRKGAVQEVKSSGGAYMGEATGIKSSVSRSRKA
jgi:U3 small nucleolar RNA-associated protein 3